MTRIRARVVSVLLATCLNTPLVQAAGGIRDFDTAELDRKVDRLRELAEDVVAGEPNATVEFTHTRFL